MNFWINGDKWYVVVLEEEEFHQRFGHQAAVTLPDLKCIFINDDEEITKETLRHELCHAWYSAMPLKSAHLTPDQVEEVFCEMIARYGVVLFKQVNYLYQELKE